MTQLALQGNRPVANMIIRGEVISDKLVEVGGRGGDLQFLTPDAHQYLDRLPLGNPNKLSDLYKLSFDNIVDYLEMVGSALDIRTNMHLQRARDLSYLTAPTTPSIVDASYANIGAYFQPDIVREQAESQIGIRYLEGWVEEQRLGGIRLKTRCFGARTIHIVAGNTPIVSALSIVRNAILRSDAIIKAPSNDPFTALAIAQTMCEVAPDHPVTKHLTVAYWRGGDIDLEKKLYQPHNVEKIIAWGGFASVKHVTQYIQPGLELISLDPKRSISIIGKEAFSSEAELQEVAMRLASDFGGLNQVGCVNARVVYVQSGTDEAGIKLLNRLGQMAYDSLSMLPDSFSTKPKKYDRELKVHVDALRFSEDWYKVIGGEDDEGAVIISQIPDAVAFSTKLNDRTVNLVPIDSLEDAARAVNAYTQTVGVYPEALKDELTDRLSLYGAQRFVSLGYALVGTTASPQDSIETLRRMGKWITNEVCDPATVPPPWLASQATSS